MNPTLYFDVVLFFHYRWLLLTGATYFDTGRATSLFLLCPYVNDCEVHITQYQDLNYNIIEYDKQCFFVYVDKTGSKIKLLVN